MLLSRPHHKHSVFAVLVVAVLALTSAVSRTEASASGTCTKVASPSGSDSASGTPSDPYRTAQKLADSLSAGEAGCLRSGRYHEESLKLTRGGRADARVRLMSYPGERAEIVGRLWVARGADYVTISDLKLNGINANRHPSPSVTANHVTFRGNDVTNQHTGICFLLGKGGWGRAGSPVLEDNRIHNCGKLPATNYDHGIYIEDAADGKIINNMIYDNADRGIQFYPSAQRTRVTGNVIDGNGEGIIFGGAGGVTSSNNVIEGNIITNSRQRENVESWYPSGNPIGRNNVVRRNCIWGGVRDDGDGGIQPQRIGFSAYDNVRANPQFVNRANKDFRLAAGSPCRGLDGGAVAHLASASSTPRIWLRSRRSSVRSGNRFVIEGGVVGAQASAVKRMAGRRVGIQMVRFGQRRVRSDRFDADGRFTRIVPAGEAHRRGIISLRAHAGGRRSGLVQVSVRP